MAGAMFKAEKPPYPLDALKPYLSKEQMHYHYNKHHKGYANKLNQLVKDKEYQNYAKYDLEKVIKKSYQYGKQTVYNNACQVWNHNFFWKCMSPKGGGKPQGKLLELIVEAHGSWEEFKADFIKEATGVFGSGWVWLIYDKRSGIEIATTMNADNCVHYSKVKTILALDVWEHVHYLDYKNNRAEFIQVFLDNLVNWKYAERQIK